MRSTTRYVKGEKYMQSEQDVTGVIIRDGQPDDAASVERRRGDTDV
jgi:hypothetical protein